MPYLLLWHQVWGAPTCLHSFPPSSVNVATNSFSYYYPGSEDRPILLVQVSGHSFLPTCYALHSNKSMDICFDYNTFTSYSPSEMYMLNTQHRQGTLHSQRLKHGTAVCAPTGGAGQMVIGLHLVGHLIVLSQLLCNSPCLSSMSLGVFAFIPEQNCATAANH